MGNILFRRNCLETLKNVVARITTYVAAKCCVKFNFVQHVAENCNLGGNTHNENFARRKLQENVARSTRNTLQSIVYLILAEFTLSHYQSMISHLVHVQPLIITQDVFG